MPESSTVVRLDGDCLRDTLTRLERGRVGRGMARPALEAIVRQASTLIERTVEAYAHSVAPGEVGIQGSAQASASLPPTGSSPTGLLYGLIQSGKTASMIVTAALAIDNGFRVIVVLTSNNVKLVEQTSERFEVLEGPLVYSSSSGTGREYEWEADRGNVERRIARHGVVFVCSKEPNHQRSLIGFLRDIGAADYPALIFDDEADQATPDTTLAARAQQRPTAPTQASTTYRLTVENDAPLESGDSIREVLRHNVFIQVTATPYALVLQNWGSPLRPEFAQVIEPGTGYVGGDRFFATVDATAHPPLVYVDGNEVGQLHAGGGQTPEGLARSVAFFLLAGAELARCSDSYPERGFKHLSHTSPRTTAHDNVANHIRAYTDILADDLETAIGGVARRDEFLWAHAELSKTCSPASLPDILRELARKLPRRQIVVLNMQGGDVSFGPYFNFIVGGNILGRGLTIDDLLVTYYLRHAQTTQMDTMLQHARMYGYREALLPYTRVFLPYRLALRFHSIHESEAALRSLLVSAQTSEPVPVAVVNNLRPTRPGILDAGELGAFRPGQQIYPVVPVHEPQLLGRATERIEALLSAVLGTPLRKNEFAEIEIERMLELIDAVPIRPEEPGDWSSATIAQVLSSIGPSYGGKGRLYVRDFERTGPELENGAIGGPEQDRARGERRPVLFMFRESGSRPPGTPNSWSGVPFWYPTLVFPPDMPNQIFNASR
jgi:hypothetical protein